MTYVDLDWHPDKLREFCESNDNWILELPDDWSAADVETLYQRQLTVQQPYLGVISEIASDTRVSKETLGDIWTRFGTAIDVASALAMNPATPASIRKQLANHQEAVVREHAQTKIHRFPRMKERRR